MSIKSIAEELSLSKAAVSWILSGQGEKRGFKQETIKRVLDYAESIQYSPNLVARSLSLGRTGIIGVIIPFVGDVFYSQLVQAIEVEAQKRSYIITICSSEGDEKKESDLIKMLLNQQVDGIIIAPTKRTVANVMTLKQKNKPFTLIDRYFANIDTNYVIVNNQECTFELTRELIKSGSRKIAIITTDTHLGEIICREKGYREALDSEGIEYDERLRVEVLRSDYENDCIPKLDTLFREVGDVDGFIFTTHYLALESIRYFLSRKIDYNNRFNLACIHKVPGLSLLCPNMKVALMQTDKMGESAVDILCEAIKNKGEATTRSEVIKTIIQG